MNPFNPPPKKILIVNIFGIGDVLFTTPLISNLKANFPNVSISYLSNRRSATILDNHPKLDKIFIYERDEYKRISKRSKLEYFKKSFGFFKEIKAEKFDVVFDFSLNSTFDLFMLMAGIKTRIGLNYKNRGRFLTHKFPFDGFEGDAVPQYYLNMLKELGLKVQVFGLEMNVTSQDIQWAKDFIKAGGGEGHRPLVGVIPGGGASWGKEAVYRRWDPDNFSKLVDKIVENYKAKIILMGDQAEEELCRKIRSSHPTALIEAYGRTTVGQFAALMKQCDVVVLNDGGPLHVAVACGARTISIFGPVDEVVYGPFGSDARHAIVASNVLCRPCYRRFRMTDCRHISCLKNITVDQVFQKVKGLL